MTGVVWIANPDLTKGVNHDQLYESNPSLTGQGCCRRSPPARCCRSPPTRCRRSPPRPLSQISPARCRRSANLRHLDIWTLHWSGFGDPDQRGRKEIRTNDGGRRSGPTMEEGDPDQRFFGRICVITNPSSFFLLSGEIFPKKITGIFCY